MGALETAGMGTGENTGENQREKGSVRTRAYLVPGGRSLDEGCW